MVAKIDEARLARLRGAALRRALSPNAMSDHLIDPDILWSKSTALRERVKTVKDELLACRMRRLADDMASLAVELRLATIVEEVRG